MFIVHIVNEGIKVETASGFFLTEGVDFVVVKDKEEVYIPHFTQEASHTVDETTIPVAGSHATEEPEAKPIG